MLNGVRRILPAGVRGFLGRSANRLRHFGTDRFCPICRSHVRRFLPHGTPVREEALCPVCRCKEAHRLAYLYLSRRTDILQRPMRVLHVAPEADLARWFKSLSTVRYISGDYALGVGDLNLDLCCLPFRDNSFDLLYAAHVLNALPNDQMGMREIQRVLKPGGISVLNVPLQPGVVTVEPEGDSRESRLRLCNDPDIYRIYGEDFAERFGDIGMQIELEDFYGSLPLATCRRFGLQATPVVRCTKRLANA